jgi:PAS domain S-box-containing protein
MADVNARRLEIQSAAKLRQAEVDAEAKLRQAEVDAEAKLRQAEVPAAAKLLLAEVRAEATLLQAEVPATAKLLQAEIDAEATLLQAEVPATAKLLQAEVDAEATLRRAEALAPPAVNRPQPRGDAETAAATLAQAKADAEATLQRAEAPAAATLAQAKADAAATLQRAEAPAAAKLAQAEIEAAATLRRAEAPATAKLAQAEVDAAATLREAEQALDHQCDAFERFFALSIDMMCISTSNGYFTRASPSFDVHGFDREDMLSRPVLDLVHPDDRPATRAAYDRLASGSPTINFENRYRCKDGSYRWLSWASGRDSSGIVYSMARDITEAKRSHNALIRAKDAAQDANRELESFSHSVAHDLRAPLRSIDGFSQALLEDYVEKLDATGKRYLVFIRDSAHHMAQLINDLLDLSRITRGEVRREAVDLGELARAASARLHASQPERHVDVLIQDGLTDEGDPRLLAIVLDNLIGNAWKFTAKRADARIEFGATKNNRQLVYFMRDNGAGFDMARADKLFGVFQRLHSASEFEGTGVGLATVQRVVARHGGRVWAEGQVGRGATFYFTLHEPPVAEQDLARLARS